MKALILKVTPIEDCKTERYLDTSNINNETVSYGGVEMESELDLGEWKSKKIPLGTISHYEIEVSKSGDLHTEALYKELESSYYEACRQNDEHEFTHSFRKPIQVIEKDQLMLEARSVLSYVASSYRSYMSSPTEVLGRFITREFDGINIPLGESKVFIVPIYIGMGGWYFNQGVQSYDVTVRMGTRRGSYDYREIEWGKPLEGFTSLLSELEEWCENHPQFNSRFNNLKRDTRYASDEAKRYSSKKKTKGSQKDYSHQNKSAGHNPFEGLADLF